MQLLVLVLNKTEYLDDILKQLLDIGIRGATILESTGMARTLDRDEMSIFGSLRMVVDQDRENSRTVFIAVQDSLVDIARKTIDQAVGGLCRPDTGVLIGMPINFFDGKVSEDD